MKKSIALLFILFVLKSFSQSVTDSVLVNSINNYRIENNLETLKFTKLGYKAAKHHNEYLNKHPEVGIVHEEKNDTPFQYERLKKYLDSDNRIWTSAENLFATQINPGLDLSSLDIANWVAYRTLKSWKNSEGHNRNLLLKTAKYVGIHSMIIKDNSILVVTYVTYSFSNHEDF